MQLELQGRDRRRGRVVPVGQLQGFPRRECIAADGRCVAAATVDAAAPPVTQQACLCVAGGSCAQLRCRCLLPAAGSACRSDSAEPAEPDPWPAGSLAQPIDPPT